MAIVFNADEILAMAEQIERNGAAFYRRAAEVHPKAARLFNELAAQEDAHLKTFSAMRGNLPEDLRQETAYDPQSEAGLYLKALADQRVFVVDAKPELLFKGDESISDIFNMAIGKEKDSIVFYAGLQGLVPASLGAYWLGAIIAEEVRHIAWLNQAFDEFAST